MVQVGDVYLHNDYEKLTISGVFNEIYRCTWEDGEEENFSKSSIEIAIKEKLLILDETTIFNRLIDDYYNGDCMGDQSVDPVR